MNNENKRQKWLGDVQTRIEITKSKKAKTKGRKTKMRTKLITLLLGICTLAGGAVILLPRPIVSPPSTPFDNNNRLSVSFDISNNGFIPLNDCEVSLGIGQIGAKDAHFDQSSIPSFEPRIHYVAWQHHRLAMDEKFTIVPSDIMSGVSFADIAVIVSYKPWFLPFHREKKFRFVALKQSNSQLFWRSWPLNEPPPSANTRQDN